MKKSQIQIGETIAVLFVFFILIAIGFIFYIRIIKEKVNSEMDYALELNSVSVAQRAMFLPELQCSGDNVIEADCIDKLKLELSTELMKQNQVYYYDIFEFAVINVTQIYPPEEKMKWSAYYRPISNPKSKYVTSIPVSLKDPLTNKKAFGVLTIESYVT